MAKVCASCLDKVELKYDTNYEETVDLHRFWFVDHDGFICPRWGDAGDFRLLRDRW